MRRKASYGRKFTFFLIFAITLCVVAVAYGGLTIGGKEIFKSAKDIRTGIDIRGGVNATFTPADTSIDPTDAELDAARTIFETRLDDDGILDRNITIDRENNAVIVEFPWGVGEEKDPQKAIQELGETANLTFCSLKKGSDNQLEVDENGVPARNEVLLTGANVISAEANYQNGQSMVLLNFDETGAQLFKEATSKHINDYIGIFLDDTFISAPMVNETIDNGEAVITGVSSEEAKEYASKINAGALPYAMASSNYSSISATLGTKALSVMLLAGLITVIIICLFMLFVYRLPGFVACINLILQLGIQLLIFANTGLTITLPGIAGVILSIGMSVDSNVIISERIREEMRKGKSLIGAIDGGYGRALTAITDCNITTAIVALLLIAFGSGSVLSFGYTLIIGIILNFLVSVLVSRWMIRSLSSFKFLKNPKLYGYKEVQAND